MTVWSIRQVALVCLLAAVALLAAACGSDGSDESFKIGVMESLTGPGETYGTVSSQAKGCVGVSVGRRCTLGCRLW